MIALRSDLTYQRHLDEDSYQSRIEFVAKLSVSLPDDLVQDLKQVARGNVSAFVAAAVRNELDRRRLHAFVQELVDELGPSDEAEVARYSEMFAAIAVASDVIGEDSSS
jgi:post-segregation antitoxin (ccd killing protein)